MPHSSVCATHSKQRFDIIKLIEQAKIPHQSLRYRPHERVFEQGQHVEGVFILCEGRAHLIRAMKCGKRQILIPFLRPGKIIGINEILLEHRHLDYSMQAVDNILIEYVSAPSFKRLMVNNSALLKILVFDLLWDKQNLQRRLISTLGRNANERVVFSLLDICSELKNEYIPLNNGELAALTGNTTVTVCRQLTQLKRNRALNRFNGLMALDIAKLKAMA